MSNPHQPWQPDERKLGNWASMFEPQERQAATPPPAGSQVEPPFEDERPNLDPNEYKPWQLQRGRSRPALMLGLRRFDPKSGLWHLWSMAYPSLYAVDSIGDRIVSLDFGTRQFVIEGMGLDVLADHLQQGIVLNIVEYAAQIWTARAEGPVVIAIQKPGGQ